MSLNPPIRDWHGQRVWLIGASTGIGRALAQQLHELGAKVIVSARQMEALQAFADQHPGSVALSLDVTDATAVQAAAQTVLANGPLDLACYCAGHYHAMRATAIDLPDLLRHHEVNTVGALQVLAALTPIMSPALTYPLLLISGTAWALGFLLYTIRYGPWLFRPRLDGRPG